MTQPSISELLRSAARAEPTRAAVIDGEEQLTFEELESVVAGTSRSLHDRGARPGSIVSLEIPSSIDFVVCALAILRTGATVSAINSRLGAFEQGSIRERTQPQVRICSTTSSDGDSASAPVLAIGDLRGAWAGPPLAEDGDLNPCAEACIVWTSGTTGTPKGAVYSTTAMHAISAAIGAWSIAGDVRLLTLPFAHVGFMTRLVDELSKRVTMVVGAEPWSAARQLREVERCAVTVMGGVPTQWLSILDAPELATTELSSLRLVGIGAAPATPDVIQRIRAAMGCPVITRYTSTEAGITTGTQPNDPPEVVAHTIGKPALGVEVHIVDAAGSRLSDHGAEGELICRSPAMMTRYFRDPELTEEAIDADGFLHTGDRVTRRADGNLVILGRTKEMFIRGGYNVYPVEVEAVLSTLPSLVSVAVVPVPNERLGELGIACVVLNAQHPVPTLQDLREHCAGRIADYKAPDGLLIFHELPLTPMGKIDRSTLRTDAYRAWNEP